MSTIPGLPLSGGVRVLIAAKPGAQTRRIPRRMALPGLQVDLCEWSSPVCCNVSRPT